jgi:hypothetical protein
MLRIQLKHSVIAVGLLAVFFTLDNAQAQVSQFCPSTVPGQAGAMQFIDGAAVCTNGISGAYSNAVLASQALTELSQSATQETTRTTTNAISDRRQAEEQRCPEGFERVGGACRRVAAEATSTPPPPPPAPVSATKKGTKSKQKAAVSSPRLLPTYKAPPLVLDQGVRFATWARVFGDYERRTGTGTTSALSLALDGRSETTTIGGLTGIDVTARNLLSQSDGFIVGLLAGYYESRMNLATTSTPTLPGIGTNGAGSLKAQVLGPSVGIYGTYFNGGFSVDNTIKVDLLTLNEDFNYLLNFGAILPGGPATQATFLSGSLSTSLTNTSSFGNLNYKFPIFDGFWIEPTFGYNYTETRYGSNAALLGLADGHLLRLQGGARFGFESLWDTVRVTSVLTGLVYNNVIVEGGVLQNGIFGTPNAPFLFPDQGRFRGLGALAFNFDFGGGLSSFVKGEVRGGQDLFGAGGTAGVRYQW